MILFAQIKRYKVIIQNAGYLSLIEIFRLIMPFVALPYIISVVGADNYGLAVFAQTIVSYFVIFINWGLDVSAVKSVSIYRNDEKELSRIVSTILSIKTLLLLFSFILLLLGLLWIPILKDYPLLFLFAFLTCFSELLYPIWFYMGIEKMKYLTLVKTFSILFYTITVFIFVRQESDYEKVVLLQSLGNVLGGCISMYILLRIYHVKFVCPRRDYLKQTFVESTPFFLSRLSVILNTNIAKTVSGFFLPMASVTALDLAGKVGTAGIMPMQALSQSVYPHIAKNRDTAFVRKYLNVNILLSLFVALLMFILAPWGIPVLAGGPMDEAVMLTRILALWTFMAGINTYIGSPVLVSFGYPNPFNQSVIFSTILLAVLYVILSVFSCMWTSAFALVLVVTELFILVYRIFFCYKYNIIRL